MKVCAFIGFIECLIYIGYILIMLGSLLTSSNVNDAYMFGGIVGAGMSGLIVWWLLVRIDRINSSVNPTVWDYMIAIIFVLPIVLFVGSFILGVIR